MFFGVAQIDLVRLELLAQYLEESQRFFLI